MCVCVWSDDDDDDVYTEFVEKERSAEIEGEQLSWQRRHSLLDQDVDSA